MLSKTVTQDRYGFVIGGKRRYLLAGTVAYFRMAREDWRDRLLRLRDSGFNTVDVYVPWNYHETVEGVFDFQSENRDLAAYLELAQELGLFVYFRPGPYICNEWDGGGLPSWLYTKAGVRLRQNDTAYLEFVFRYLQQVNEIVRPFLYTNGGPVILYALENELDFFPCEDPHGYISALRDKVIADGIDVPLTACIGNRTPVQAAMGYADGVLPTPNIYEGKHAEREAALARTVLHGSHYVSGKSMADVPAFVTEMNRDENSLKRILSTGYRGLGPFNFAGGANFGYTHAVNNWNNLSYLSTSIDFAGMIGFDGRLQAAFYGARRLAGLINAFEEEILCTEPVTSETGGPSTTSEKLVYSLTRNGGAEGAFVFLYNETEAAKQLHVQVGDLQFPRHSTLSLTPHYTHVALANLSLEKHQIPATLRYSTAEVAGLTRLVSGEVRLLLCGESGSEGELSLVSADTITLDVNDTGVRCIPEESGATFVFRFGEMHETVVQIGEARLLLAVCDREIAARDGLPNAPEETVSAAPLDLLAVPRTEQEVIAPALSAGWNDSAGRTLESLGVYQAAGWYEFAFALPEENGSASEITLPHAGDIVTAFLDGNYIGTFIGDGGPMALPLSEGIAPGNHILRLRAEIWGHSNFHDTRWPSAHLGSLRGAWGTPLYSGEILEGSWRFAPETLIVSPPTTEQKAINGPLYVSGGSAHQATFAVPVLQTANRGAVLTLAGNDCTGEIRVGERIVGRFLFGPSLGVALTGGPTDRFLLPGAFLASGDAVSLLIRGAGSGGAITGASVEILPGENC